MQTEKKKLSLEKILIIVIIFFAVLLIGLIVANIIKNNSNKSNQTAESSSTEKKEKEEIDYSTEDDAEADNSIATKQFNNDLMFDVTKYISAVVQYQANNRGAIPTTDDNWNSFHRNYLETELVNKYQFVHCDHELGNCTLPTALSWAKDGGIIYTASHATCEGENIVYATGKRKLAVYTHLKGESNGINCQNN